MDDFLYSLFQDTYLDCIFYKTQEINSSVYIVYYFYS